MLLVYKENDKIFNFTRLNLEGGTIKSVPQGIWFAVRKKNNDETVFVKSMADKDIVQLADGSWNIQIKAEDTRDLSYSDKYVCDVKIRDENGLEVTIVPLQDFVVGRVAVRLENEGGISV